MISIFGALNGSILSGARVPYAMARDGLLFSRLAAVHPRFYSPHVAVVVQTIIGALISLTGTFQQLFTYTIFANWCFSGAGRRLALCIAAQASGVATALSRLGLPGGPGAVCGR